MDMEDGERIEGKELERMNMRNLEQRSKLETKLLKTLHDA